MNSILRSVSFVVLIVAPSLLASSSRFSHQKCGLYGLPPCNFVPSTTGVTPVCATPGKTYCEFVQNYPSQQIRVLLDKWGMDNVNDLIVDETVDDFEVTRFNDIPWYNDQKPPDPHQTPTFTEIPNAVPNGGGNGDGGGYHHVGDAGYNYPNPNKVHTPATPPQQQPPLLPPVHHAPPPPLPPAPSSTAGYLPNNNAYTVNHNPGANRYWSGFSYSINQRPTLPNNNYLPIEPRYTLPQYIHSHPNAVTVVHHPAQWLNRYIRDTSSHRRLTREAQNNLSVQSLPTQISNHLQHFNSSKQIYIKKTPKSTLTAIDLNSGQRIKRQSPGREQLCQTTYQYITPQAALNSQGNWMYIVNQVDTTRQLVRTETCASSVCSNLCQLPNGYSSRCEQKYVQKRLIALNADGTNLYTDTFWFPSCCACTIAGST